MSSQIFSKLEKLNDEKFPSCVKTILIQSGFNTFASLRQIDEKVLNEIESFVTANRSIINNIDCCGKDQYKNNENFRFLPGHKAIVLNLPKYVTEFEQKNPNKKKSKSIEVAPEAALTISDEDMKKQLLSNLEKYFRKLNYDLPGNIMTDRNIIMFERQQNDTDVKCKYSCPFCVKIIPVNFKKYWRSANITSHFKQHVENDRAGAA